MTFDEFLATYNVADFAWELFLGLSPTFIALLSIWITTKVNKAEKKRENHSSQIKELQLMSSELMVSVLDSGTYLIDAIQHADAKEESDSLLKRCYSSIGKMLIDARKLNNYANIRSTVFNCKSMKFDNVFAAIANYSDDLLKILAEYNDVAPKTPKQNFKQLCDNVQQKCIEATEKVEDEISNYCIALEKH